MSPIIILSVYRNFISNVCSLNVGVLLSNGIVFMYSELSKTK